MRTTQMYCGIVLAILVPLASGQLKEPVHGFDNSAPASSVAPPDVTIFAPGVISGPANDGSPTFSPDGNTLFFTRSTATWSVILESHRSGDGWSEPQVAPFSGQWPDSSPGMSPDGSFLIFNSIRPVASSTSAENGNKSPRVANLWRVNRVKSGWSDPVRLPESINIGNAIWKPSVAGDGGIYFVSIDTKGAKRLFVSRFANGSYQMAQPLSFSDGSTADVDPEIAPDGSFLVFCSSGRLQGDPKDHLYIVFRRERLGAR